jgi:hypothetical protein
MSEDGKGVVLATTFNDHTHGYFTYSLAALLQYDALHDGHVIRPECGFIALSTGPRMAEARNMVIDRFAENHPDADWLLFIDADMTFDPDLVESMMKVADPDTCPILGALCFAGGRGNDPWPTIWRENAKPGEGFWNIERIKDYPPDALIEVAATGAACILIHRRVLAAMKRPWPDGFGTLADGKTPNIQPWFSEGLVGPGQKALGEDTAFCRKARMMGIPVQVHTGIKTGHMKSFEITEDRYLALQELYRKEAEATRANRAQRRANARNKVAKS